MTEQRLIKLATVGWSVREERMYFWDARWRHHRLMGSLMALSTLLMFGREAAAECMPTAPARANTPGHLIQSASSMPARMMCGRVSASDPSGSHNVGGPSINYGVNYGHPSGFESGRWSLARTRSAEHIANEQQGTSPATPVQQSLSEMHWADARDWIHNPPEWLKAAKNYRRQGMPIIHLMQSQNKNTLLALGVSNHGKPGLYLTQKLPF
jgi:hypothetical protein